ncbi:IS110 family RNA-guided transposase [Planctobacterium marinum]|uniref:IS110 family transposase n=1 Tax=Planctobacterium marinum TaxID=1631968 RepID=UPI001E396875|nr:IS110 family transposase [Planctobacterium marinum]MCC2603928.1 IS110 family transposase [Planctobacterium marinum]
MKCSVISIDLAKNIFQVCALDESRQILSNNKVRRSNLLNELRQFEPTLVVMEACYSANPWGRRIEQIGHTVKCVPAFAVKPFLVGNKNDANDALAIAEASFRPKTRFIDIKPVEQQDIQSLQRIRELLVRQRTSTINQLRGLLAEYGEVCSTKPGALLKAVPMILEDASNELSYVARRFIQQLFDQIQEMRIRIDETDNYLQGLIADRSDYALLMGIPGVGPHVAATILASVNDIHSFKNGRQFAAWIGLTPSQHASGEMNRMGKITKRGNQSLRRMLVLGARAVLNWCHKHDDNVSKWLQKIKAKMHSCKCVTAFANKLARIIWAVLAKQTPFDAKLACSA